MTLDSEVKYLSVREHYINGDIDEESALKIITTINDINFSDDYWEETLKSNGISSSFIRKTITIYLNTSGGNVYDAFAIYGCIKSSKTPIKIVCSGKVMSAGILILMSCNNRFSTEGTTFMIHQVSHGTVGNALDLKVVSSECERIQNEMYKIISDNTNLTIEEIIKNTTSDWYFDLTKAKELGLINN